MLGWIGNLFIVAGLAGITSKRPRRYAFLFSVAGEAAWITNAYLRDDWALASICTVFLLMAVRGFVNWRVK